MKCLACGRGMVDRGTHFECSNVLCDYVEEICHMEILARPKQDLLNITFKDFVRNFSENGLMKRR
jgi:hypothetical protein